MEVLRKLASNHMIMKTRNLSFLGKLARNGFVKASLLALLTIVLMAILMNLATNVAFSSPLNNNGLTPSSFLSSNDNCTTSLDADQFKGKYDFIAGKYFEETRIKLSWELVDNYCLSSVQVRDLMKLFSYDSTRTKFATYAIGKVLDPENFTVCKETFMIYGNDRVIDDLVKEYQSSMNK